MLLFPHGKVAKGRPDTQIRIISQIDCSEQLYVEDEEHLVLPSSLASAIRLP